MAGTLFRGADIFDGDRLGPGSLLVEAGRISAILPPDTAVPGARLVELDGGTLAPGFVDLQVNGGGGVMFNDAPGVATLARMAEAHAGLGTLAFLPTLITDTPEITRAAVDAVARAVAEGIPGIAGLHLEGPHLSLARKGAHDPALIRPMTGDDLSFLLEAARKLPRLLVTIAPESVAAEQISAMAKAGIMVSLGHTDGGFDTCRAGFAAGARVVTHLFNAMSQLGNREPGLVGAALATGAVSAGLIADGIHVHAATIRAALAAKAGPGGLFLVTDAMAPAGTDMAAFRLNGREIRREGGRLTLAEGTLAGADLEMARALAVLTRDVGVALDRALAMATSIPARVLGRGDRHGTLAPGRAADFVHLQPDLSLAAVWRGGERMTVLGAGG
ncbi:N-acetylglucosamine-6-phosphate deacetylase [Albidovulum sp.]|jgi:N-acetylglucosamine-6-phosphate deacetylase|uniref:N-acetylglucosamine-6-phosphate deacetylase n=1 Tax=Albidovulum sp. TaxID=1872424 RepID=UPI0030606326